MSDPGMNTLLRAAVGKVREPDVAPATPDRSPGMNTLLRSIAQPKPPAFPPRREAPPPRSNSIGPPIYRRVFVDDEWRWIKEGEHALGPMDLQTDDRRMR